MTAPVCEKEKQHHGKLNIFSLTENYINRLANESSVVSGHESAEILLQKHVTGLG
jgi:hypothetical protein